MRKIKKYLRNILWRLLKVKTKLNSGVEVYVSSDNDWFVYNEIFVNEEYKAAVSSLTNSMVNDPLILDLGANVGYFSLYTANALLVAGKSDFTIYSFEGSSKNFQVLARHAEQELLENKISFWHGLIGLKEGSASLSTATDHFGYAVSNANGAKAETARYIDIEEVLRHDHRRISLLKCDIEGSEEQFIENYAMLLGRIDVAVIEFHSGNCDVPKCRESLSKAGLVMQTRVNVDSIYNTSVELFVREE